MRPEGKVIDKPMFQILNPFMSLSNMFNHNKGGLSLFAGTAVSCHAELAQHGKQFYQDSRDEEGQCHLLSSGDVCRAILAYS